jgi:glycogen operon protein
MDATAVRTAFETRNPTNLRIGPGRTLPFGATVMPNGVNFSVFSMHATAAMLVLFRKGEKYPFAELVFPPEFRVGQVYTMLVFDLDWQNTEYGFRMMGPNNPKAGQIFNPDVILLDPYAKAVSGRGVWGERADPDNPYPHRARITVENFDWKGDRPLHIPVEDTVIYEMHVRSFTKHPSSGVRNPGTYDGVREKIPYLRQLGVNCVELMPMFDFDEFENSRVNKATGETLYNYWGYSTVSFFAPKAGYAAAGRDGGEINELKNLIKDLHSNGIEVVLDVVFNHTAEGNEKGPMISFKGVDNKTFYMLTPEGYYFNFSGTGNTFNCNHPAVMTFIIDCLRHWVIEYHIDGFRFDLASILARAENGAPLADPPLLKNIAHDPILRSTKLIAEPWDAGGLYHVGAFPAYGRWAEWNGKYRDDMRRFLKGDPDAVDEVSQRMMGSPDLYPGRGPIASINFITAHDGFTLYDLVSYNEKHNEANGENNRDGHNDNLSWNCGAEGETDDPNVLALRRRQMRNAIAMLFLSEGVPMLLMGDEVARTQRGNNNTYCQDNDLNYFDWTQVETNADLFRFVQRMIAFRWAHPVLRNGYHFQNRDYQKAGVADITWHGVKAWHADWSDESRMLAFMLSGKHAKGGLEMDDDIYVAMNMHWEDQTFEIPRPPTPGTRWFVFANTGQEAPDDICDPDTEPLLETNRVTLKTHSVLVLVSHPSDVPLPEEPEAEADSADAPTAEAEAAQPAPEGQADAGETDTPVSSEAPQDGAKG